MEGSWRSASTAPWARSTSSGASKADELFASRAPSSPELVSNAKQGLKREVGSIASVDHRPGPKAEGHCRGLVQEILDASAEEDGDGEGAVLAEGDEQREIQVEGNVETVSRGDSEDQTGRKCHAELRSSTAGADVREAIDGDIEGMGRQDDGATEVIAQKVREHPRREPQAEVVLPALQ